MKPARSLSYMIFGLFAMVNVYAVFSGGPSSFFHLLESENPWFLVGAFDLLIALGLSCIWMYQDARKKGKSAAGYIILTCLTGSIGTLLYLIREYRTETESYAS